MDKTRQVILALAHDEATKLFDTIQYGDETLEIRENDNHETIEIKQNASLVETFQDCMIIDSIPLNMDDLIRQLYNLVYMDNDNGLILSFHDLDSTIGKKESFERLFSLLSLKRKYDAGDIVGVQSEIRQIYQNAWFVLQIDMRNKLSMFTPGGGLCWLIAEYQAYYRGLHHANSTIETWKEFIPPKVALVTILEEAYILMKKQKGDYTEANRIDDHVEVKHNYFIEEWENEDSKTKLLQTGCYKQEVPNQTSVSTRRKRNAGRWGSHFSFGTLFFSGKGSLNQCPPVNLFVDNANLFGKSGQLCFDGSLRREGYARLCNSLPLYGDQSGFSQCRLFSFRDLDSILNHNNNILLSCLHFQPLDWPGRREGVLTKAVEYFVEETLSVLSCEWNFDTNIEISHFKKYFYNRLKLN